jgi:hypothetical protein
MSAIPQTTSPTWIAMRIRRPEEHGSQRISGTGSSVGPNERDVAKVPPGAPLAGDRQHVLGRVDVRHGPHPLGQVQAEAASATADVNDGVVGICAPARRLPVCTALAGFGPLLHVAVLPRAAVAF